MPFQMWLICTDRGAEDGVARFTSLVRAREYFPISQVIERITNKTLTLILNSDCCYMYIFRLISQSLLSFVLYYTANSIIRATVCLFRFFLKCSLAKAEEFSKCCRVLQAHVFPQFPKWSRLFLFRLDSFQKRLDRQETKQEVIKDVGCFSETFHMHVQFSFKRKKTKKLWWIK